MHLTELTARRMGGAKRYPSIAVHGVDGFRKGLNPSYVLMEPKGARVKLPSDLAGITTIRYRFETKDTAVQMGPACNELRDHIMKLGRNI